MFNICKPDDQLASVSDICKCVNPAALWSIILEFQKSILRNENLNFFGDQTH